MNDSGPERREENCGRRSNDDVCLAHSGFEANINHLKDTAIKHGTLLGKVFNRINGILVGVILMLLAVGGNLFVLLIKGS